MNEKRVLESRDVSGKGGYRPKYTAKMDEKEFTKYIIRTIIDSLMRDFPMETRDVLNETMETRNKLELAGKFRRIMKNIFKLI